MNWVKYCIKCGSAFDIDTSKDLCPECRREGVLTACGDCAILEGELHEEGCDMELCSKCGKQVLGWGKCKGAKPEPFFQRITSCSRCGEKYPELKMVSDKEWKFICGITYPLGCVLCEKCMKFIKQKREEMGNAKLV